MIDTMRMHRRVMHRACDARVSDASASVHRVGTDEVGRRESRVHSRSRTLQTALRTVLRQQEPLGQYSNKVEDCALYGARLKLYQRKCSSFRNQFIDVKLQLPSQCLLRRPSLRFVTIGREAVHQCELASHARVGCLFVCLFV